VSLEGEEIAAGCKPDSVEGVIPRMIISLGRRSPDTSSGLPGSR